MMEQIRFSVDTLTHFCRDAFTKFGFSSEEAASYLPGHGDFVILSSTAKIYSPNISFPRTISYSREHRTAPPVRPLIL